MDRFFIMRKEINMAILVTHSLVAFVIIRSKMNAFIKVLLLSY